MLTISEEHITLIKNKAKELGFDDIGFTNALELTDDKAYLKEWLDNNMHAGMQYMANHFEKRTNPSLLVEGAKSVMVMLTNYTPSEKPLNADAPIIARYAYGQDYHDIIKKRLHNLYNFIKEEIDPSLDGRCFVDSAPVLERSLAAKAGLGWIGKNTHLIHKRLGSYVFISEIISNLILPEGDNVKDACGGCTRCIDACPTEALDVHKLDSNKCISYLTIENKGEISDQFTGQMENRVFGCDICQEACPWTWKSRPNKNDAFQPNEHLLKLSKSDWQNLSSEQFPIYFKKSAVKRAKFAGLRRNIDFLDLKSDL